MSFWTSKSSVPALHQTTDTRIQSPQPASWSKTMRLPLDVRASQPVLMDNPRHPAYEIHFAYLPLNIIIYGNRHRNLSNHMCSMPLVLIYFTDQYAFTVLRSFIVHRIAQCCVIPLFSFNAKALPQSIFSDSLG